MLLSKCGEHLSCKEGLRQDQAAGCKNIREKLNSVGVQMRGEECAKEKYLYYYMCLSILFLGWGQRFQ